MTLLAKASPTISQEIETKLSCDPPRKSGCATFSIAPVLASTKASRNPLGLNDPSGFLLSVVNSDPIEQRNQKPAPHSGIELAAVSYTHLDVYKRQLYSRGSIDRKCRTANVILQEMGCVHSERGVDEDGRPQKWRRLFIISETSAVASCGVWQSCSNLWQRSSRFGIGIFLSLIHI